VAVERGDLEIRDDAQIATAPVYLVDFASAWLKQLPLAKQMQR
jgi:hypothetical protein